jgi:hypothetical protein
MYYTFIISIDILGLDFPTPYEVFVRLGVSIWVHLRPPHPPRRRSAWWLWWAGKLNGMDDLIETDPLGGPTF